MSFRRLILPLVLVVVAVACSDAPPPLAPPTQMAGPQFLRWAPSVPTQFQAVGAVTVSKPTGLAGSGGMANLVAAAAPVAVDNASSVTASTQTLSWSHTVGSGVNRFLLVGVSIRSAKSSVTGVTYGGRSLSLVGAQNNSDNAVRTEIWRLAAPASGTAAVIVSLSGGAKVVGGAVSFTGVDPQTPLGSFTAVGGSDNTIDPYLSLGSTVGDGLAFAVVATEGSAGSLTPSSGQVGEYVRFYGSSGGDVAGAAGVASGAAATSMSWTKSGKAKWSIGAVVLRRAPSTGTGVDTYQASFWAVRGKSRTLQINYISGGTASPYLRFTASDPKYVPGRGTLAMGDSVLITVTLDPSMIGAEFEPAGLTFGTPSSLTYWYGVLGGDLNGDGVVDNADAYIAQQSLGMWYRASATSAWTAMASTASALDMSVSSGVEHFSEYAVSW